MYLPKSTTYRQIPQDESFFIIIEATEEFRVPEAGLLGRHHPFDSSLVTVPEAEAFDDDGRDEYEVRLRQREGRTSLFYPHNPLDVEGWKGDNFAFTYNIEDYDVIASDTVHLVPMVHLFLQATGVYVANFLPRRAEGRPGAERPPWYHRNVDYDEIAFYHGGSVFGINMPPGLISHAPQASTTACPSVLASALAVARTSTSASSGRCCYRHRRRLTPAPVMRASAPVEVAEEVQV